MREEHARACQATTRADRGIFPPVWATTSDAHGDGGALAARNDLPTDSRGPATQGGERGGGPCAGPAAARRYRRSRACGGGTDRARRAAFTRPPARGAVARRDGGPAGRGLLRRAPAHRRHRASTARRAASSPTPNDPPPSRSGAAGDRRRGARELLCPCGIFPDVWGSNEQHRGLRVFVSHTSDLNDYPAERTYVRAATDAVRRADHHAVFMDDFPAVSTWPASYCQEQVRSWQVYLGVIGFRYGSLVQEGPAAVGGPPRADSSDPAPRPASPGSLPQARPAGTPDLPPISGGVSYTELEYLTAAALDLPRLLFLLDEDTPVPRRLRDVDLADIDAFRRRLYTAGVVVRTFHSADDLEAQVTRALAWLARHGPVESGLLPEPRGDDPRRPTRSHRRRPVSPSGARTQTARSAWTVRFAWTVRSARRAWSVSLRRVGQAARGGAGGDAGAVWSPPWSPPRLSPARPAGLSARESGVPQPRSPAGRRLH